jgi:hypothetical protein
MNNLFSLPKTISLLQANTHIEVLYSKSVVTPFDQKKAEERKTVFKEQYGLECPPGLEDALFISDELFVYWKNKEKEESKILAGEFHLRSPFLFASESELNDVFKHKKYDSIDLEETRVFDYYPYNGGPIHALLKVEGGTLRDEVLIFNEEDVFRTSLTYQTYLAALHVTKGVIYWQYLYCQRIKAKDYEKKQLKRGLDFIEAQFSAEDYAELRTLWKKLK